jgi:hypothetical protein
MSGPIANDQFRQDYPEFANVALFPDSALTYWLMVANMLVNPCVFTDTVSYTLMNELLAAHHLKLEADAARIALNGGVAGTTQGPISGKTVDKVTISFAVEAAKEDGAGSYNSTVYGQRYWHLTQLFGAGGVQLGAPGPGSLVFGLFGRFP